jgi:sigma-B regulation protein RsbU (phosphoserine phosphatase)
MVAASQDTGDGALDSKQTEIVAEEIISTLRERVGNLSKLIDVTALISSSLNLDEVMSRVMEMAKEMMEAEAASIMLWNEEEEVLEFELSIGGAGVDKLKTVKIPKGEGIAGTVVSTGEPLLVADVSKDNRFFHKADETTGFVTKSILAAPLMVHDRIVGVSEVLNHKAGRPFTEYDLELFATFCRQVAVAIENARLHEQEVKKSLLDQQMKLASEIQKSFLPQVFPNDDAGRFEVYAFTRSAHEVGGDLFSFAELSAGRIGIALGDVSGKGVPAAIYMARVVSEFRMLCTSGAPPHEVLTTLNTALSRGKMHGMFVTFAYGILDPASGKFRIANAGHLPPILLNKNGDARWMGSASGPPLGMLPHSQYTEEIVDLEPSDTLMFYSDGIVEARDKTGRQFEEDRLMKVVSNAGPGAKNMLSYVLASVEEFSHGAEQADDMTLVTASWTG